MHPSYPVLAIDIGGTKTAAAVIDERYAVHCRQEIATEAQAGPERALERIAELGQSVMAACQRTIPHIATPHAAGIAIAGQVDVASGDVLQATENMPGWTGFPAGRRLAAKLRMPVVVDNDVNCFALAEASAGAGRPYRHFLLAAVGTAIGGGIVIDGRLYRGLAGGAGEIGQLCMVPEGGRPCTEPLSGCLEAYAASSVMVARSGYASIHALAAAYVSGEPVAAVEEAALWLGRGLAGVAHVLAPEAILIGGSAVLLGERYLAAVRTAFYGHTLPSFHAIPLVPTALGADSGLIGAGLLIGTSA